MQKKAVSVQNRPEYPAVSAPVDLPDVFPIVCSEIYFQTDRPITHLHWHNALEIGYCHQGAGIFIVESKVMPFSKGDVIIITWNETHLAQSRKNTSSQWTWLYCDPARLLAPYFHDADAIDLSPMSGPNFHNIFQQKKYSRIAGAITDIIHECTHKAPFSEQVVRSLLFTALVLVRRTVSRTGSRRSPAQQKRTDQAMERIRPAIERICTRYHEDLRVEQLAETCCMSVTNFRRVFRRAMRKPPREYVIWVRISMASVELRDSTRTVSDIAMSSGFPTLSSFNRQFRRTMGDTPRHWRKG